MTTTINFSDRDWRGNISNEYETNITGNITSTDAYTPIHFGQTSGTFQPYEIRIAGNATSPASFGANPVDKTLFLELVIMQRSQVPSGPAARIPIIKWRPSETSTIRDTNGIIVIPINTIIPDGDLWFRICSSSGTFTAADFVVTLVQTSKTNPITSFAFFNTTNNLYSTAGGNANSVQILPASTSGMVEFT